MKRTAVPAGILSGRAVNKCPVPFVRSTRRASSSQKVPDTYLPIVLRGDRSVHCPAACNRRQSHRLLKVGTVELQYRDAAETQTTGVAGELALSPSVAASPAGNRDRDHGHAAAPRPVRLLRTISSVSEWLFGALTLIIGLALLATFPVLQLMSLGYLLEVSGRVSRTGRLRDGFVGVRKAARIGSFVLGTWLMLLPLRLVSSLWYDAQQIDPDGPVASRWRVGLLVLTVLMVAHVLWAWYRGGRLRHFFWPAPVLLAKRFARGFRYARTRDALWDFVVSLRLPYYLSLGLKGFVGAMVWMFVPLLLLIGSTRFAGGAAALVGLLGALLFAAVLLYLPFLQAHLAAQRRLAAVFQWRLVREEFRRAPIAYWLALVVTLLFALPLYLLKIETVPDQVTWIPSLFFVIFIFPARAITGWALWRSRRHQQSRHFVIHWMARLAAIPVVVVYVVMVYFSQFISWNGAWNVFEQHAFLVPVPFLGL